MGVDAVVKETEDGGEEKRQGKGSGSFFPPPEVKGLPLHREEIDVTK